MSDARTPTPHDPAMAALIQLFGGPLAGVSFPDVSAASLLELGDEVQLAADAVVQAQAALAAAQAGLEEQQQNLLNQGHKALAYARVYALDKPELQDALSQIVLPKSVRGQEPGKDPVSTEPEAKRRRRKSSAAPPAPETVEVVRADPTLDAAEAKTSLDEVVEVIEAVETTSETTPEALPEADD